MAAFGDEEVKQAAHGPSVAAHRHEVIWIIFNSFRSQPFPLSNRLTDTAAARIAELLAQAEIRDDQPMAIDGDQNIVWTNSTMDLLFVVNKRQTTGQLIHSIQLLNDGTGVFGISPVLKIGSCQL